LGIEVELEAQDQRARTRNPDECTEPAIMNQRPGRILAFRQTPRCDRAGGEIPQGLLNPGPALLLTAVCPGSFAAASIAVDQVAALAGFAQ
jgi:hypothetical protein